jgi:hypothetical protein
MSSIEDNLHSSLEGAVASGGAPHLSSPETRQRITTE